MQEEHEYTNLDMLKSMDYSLIESIGVFASAIVIAALIPMIASFPEKSPVLPQLSSVMGKIFLLVLTPSLILFFMSCTKTTFKKMNAFLFGMVSGLITIPPVLGLLTLAMFLLGMD